MTPISKVWIDEPACAANRACLLQETHVFLEREDSYVPAIADDAEKYFDSHRRQIIESVLSCPVAAIFCNTPTARSFHPMTILRPSKNGLITRLTPCDTASARC